MPKPLVSILIPFKNTSAFIEACLNSILDQAYSNWEIWAIDDHSIDSSNQTVQQFTKVDSRIHLLKNNGSGIIEALRLAHSYSKGELITRMDSDDLMTIDKIEHMVDSLVLHGEGHLAVGQVKYFSEQGISDGYARYESWLNGLTKTGRNYDEIYKECVIPSPCWMTYRKDLERCDAFQPNRYPEDYDLCFRFREHNLKCIPCDKVLHHWRDYKTRTSRTSEHYAQNYFLDIKLHYFIKHDYQIKRPLVVWGAGTKGKTIAKALIHEKIDFYWLCDNPKKVGKSIYGIQMRHFTFLNDLITPQSIITVANEEAQQLIRCYLSAIDQEEMKDYFFFC